MNSDEPNRVALSAIIMVETSSLELKYMLNILPFHVIIVVDKKKWPIQESEDISELDIPNKNMICPNSF